MRVCEASGSVRRKFAEWALKARCDRGGGVSSNGSTRGCLQQRFVFDPSVARHGEAYASEERSIHRRTSERKYLFLPSHIQNITHPGTCGIPTLFITSDVIAAVSNPAHIGC